MSVLSRICALTTLVVVLTQSSATAANNVPTPLRIVTGRSVKGITTLRGRDSGQQLVVQADAGKGSLEDWTRKVAYRVSPKGIVAIDDTGYVSSIAEGTATITAHGPAGVTAKVTVKVTDIRNDVRVTFANEVVPIFTKYGCNGGGCHGKSGGQNGFSLSLLGFEPAEDFAYLTREGRGRRVFPAAPESSLLLQKASGEMPHGGGSRIKRGTPAYNVIRRWIAQGMPWGSKSDPTIRRIAVFPQGVTLAQGKRQQLIVTAHYTDGSTRDVTRMTQFESNQTSIAVCDSTGLVSARNTPGVASVMARFQVQVDVSRATIPLGRELTQLPKPNNFIDEHVTNQWKTLGLPPSAVCDDATFLRRVTLDIAGRLPTLKETQTFHADRSSDKREKLVDRLLASDDYADYFANKWSAILRNKRNSPNDDGKATAAFHSWIRDNLRNNAPYDRFVRGILTAKGAEITNPPVRWYKDVHDVSSQVEDAAQLFLGTRIQCARCHHHPFEKWSQTDYYGLAAFFSKVDYKKPPKPKKGKRKGKKKRNRVPPPPLELILKSGKAVMPHPKTGIAIAPTGLGGKSFPMQGVDDPREQLAEWMTAKTNPFFARTLVNRYWKHFFGRGLVDPEDDMRTTNPPSNPELLRALETHFKKSNYDLKDLVRTICTSKTYQLSAVSNEYNGDDEQSFSRFLPRRLNAEVLLDAIDQVTLAKTRFKGVSGDTRAVQLPDNAFDSYFLKVFGRPDSSSACECERATGTNLAQMLHLLNSSEILSKAAGKRAAALAKDRRDHADRLRELYLVAYSREPAPQEMTILKAYIAKKGRNAKAAYEDIVWAVINSEEFLFNH